MWPLATGRHLAAALVDLATAALFLWCWLHPLAWRRALAADLAVLVLLEIFTLGVTVGMIEKSEKDEAGGQHPVVELELGLRSLTMFLLMCAVLLYAGTWVTLAVFGCTLASRWALITGLKTASEAELKHQQALWHISWSWLVLMWILWIMVPPPRLGMTRPGREYGFEIPAFWDRVANQLESAPQTPIALGFCYFAVVGILGLISAPHPAKPPAGS